MFFLGARHRCGDREADCEQQQNGFLHISVPFWMGDFRAADYTCGVRMPLDV
jgi:hypothetical protein